MTVTLCRCCTRFWWLFIYVTLDFRMGDWPDYRPRTSVLHFSPPPSYPFTWKVLRTFLVRKSVTTLCQDSNLVITHELKRLRLSRLCLVAVAHWRAGWKVWFNRYRPLDDGLENSRVIVTFSSRLLFFFFFIVMTSNVCVWWSENPVASWQLENVGQILRFSMATLSKVWSVTWSTRVKVPCEKLSDIWYWNVATVCPRCFLPHCRPSPCLRLLFFVFPAADPRLVTIQTYMRRLTRPLIFLTPTFEVVNAMTLTTWRLCETKVLGQYGMRFLIIRTWHGYTVERGTAWDNIGWSSPLIDVTGTAVCESPIKVVLLLLFLFI